MSKTKSALLNWYSSMKKKMGKIPMIFDIESRDITYRVLQTIQMKLILLCVWAEPAVLGSAKTALKFKFKV